MYEIQPTATPTNLVNICKMLILNHYLILESVSFVNMADIASQIANSFYFISERKNAVLASATEEINIPSLCLNNNNWLGFLLQVAP